MTGGIRLNVFPEATTVQPNGLLIFPQLLFQKAQLNQTHLIVVSLVWGSYKICRSCDCEGVVNIHIHGSDERLFCE